MSKNLTNRSEDYSKWYNELVVKADLAENSSVRGCMVIKPYGYAIWEKIQKELDNKFKETGHYNAYFPLFVPKSLFEAEEKNAEGFAKECAVVTHYRLKNEFSTSSSNYKDYDKRNSNINSKRRYYSKESSNWRLSGRSYFWIC